MKLISPSQSNTLVYETVNIGELFNLKIKQKLETIILVADR